MTNTDKDEHDTVVLTYEEMRAPGRLKLGWGVGRSGRQDLVLASGGPWTLFLRALVTVEDRLTTEETTVVVEEDVAVKCGWHTFGSFRARVVDARRGTIRVTFGEKSLLLTLRKRLLKKGRVLKRVAR